MGSQGLMMLSFIKEKSNSTNQQIDRVKKQSEVISTLISKMSKFQRNVEAIGDLVENELLSMDKAIEEAANRIQVLFMTIF